MKTIVYDVTQLSARIATAISNISRLQKHQEECIAKYKNNIKAEYNLKSIIYKFFFDIEYDKDVYGFRANMLRKHISRLSALQRSVETCVELNSTAVLSDDDLTLLSKYTRLSDNKFLTMIMNHEQEFWCNNV